MLQSNGLGKSANPLCNGVFSETSVRRSVAVGSPVSWPTPTWDSDVGSSSPCGSPAWRIRASCGNQGSTGLSQSTKVMSTASGSTAHRHCLHILKALVEKWQQLGNAGGWGLHRSASSSVVSNVRTGGQNLDSTFGNAVLQPHDKPEVRHSRHQQLSANSIGLPSCQAHASVESPKVITNRS